MIYFLKAFRRTGFFNPRPASKGVSSFGNLILFAEGEENFGGAELFWLRPAAERRGLPNDQTANLFLFFRLLAAITLLPPNFFILFLKPWVLFLFFFFGLYVRLILFLNSVKKAGFQLNYPLEKTEKYIFIITPRERSKYLRKVHNCSAKTADVLRQAQDGEQSRTIRSRIQLTNIYSPKANAFGYHGRKSVVVH